MNCQNFETIVNELVRQQRMQASVREQALAHTGDCRVCALRLADERALTDKLRAVSNEMNEMEAPAQIETELLAAFRKQELTNQFIIRRRSAIHDWRYWATAAAAVLLIVIGIAAMVVSFWLRFRSGLGEPPSLLLRDYAQYIGFGVLTLGGALRKRSVPAGQTAASPAAVSAS